ncbi:MAG: sorting protein [Chthoniobacteraceae bacterium]|nr:sorting protein [Chthoniobacteraceae bacterium]
MKMIKWPLAMAALAIGISTASAVPIINGDFELPVLPGGYSNEPAPGAITGWEVTGGGASTGTGSGDVDFIGSFWQANDGVQSVDLNGNDDAAAIRQAIALPVGTARVSFAMTGNPQGGVGTKSLTLSLLNLDGSTFLTLPDFTYEVTGANSFTNMLWEDRLGVFNVATAGTYYLEFKSGNTGTPFGPVIDSVSVPDGGMTVMLLGMSVTTLGLIRRKLS